MIERLLFHLDMMNVIVGILRIKCPAYTFVNVDYAALVYDQLLLYMKKRIHTITLPKTRAENSY